MYAGHPAALQPGAMNIIYETTKERGATILIRSSMVDSLHPPAVSQTPGTSARVPAEVVWDKAAA